MAEFVCFGSMNTRLISQGIQVSGDIGRTTINAGGNVDTYHLDALSAPAINAYFYTEDLHESVFPVGFDQTKAPELQGAIARAFPKACDESSGGAENDIFVTAQFANPTTFKTVRSDVKVWDVPLASLNDILVSEEIEDDDEGTVRVKYSLDLPEEAFYRVVECTTAAQVKRVMNIAKRREIACGVSAMQVALTNIRGVVELDLPPCLSVLPGVVSPDRKQDAQTPAVVDRPTPASSEAGEGVGGGSTLLARTHCGDVVIDKSLKTFTHPLYTRFLDDPCQENMSNMTSEQALQAAIRHAPKFGSNKKKPASEIRRKQAASGDDLTWKSIVSHTDKMVARGSLVHLKLLFSLNSMLTNQTGTLDWIA